jgi:hypothetical protein
MMKKLVAFLFLSLILFEISACSLSTQSTTSTLSTSTFTTAITTTSIITTNTTSSTVGIDESVFQNPFGFASLDVSNREEIVTGIYQVDNEIEFLDALLASDVKIIEITADLDLGSSVISQALISLGRTLVEVRDVYRSHSNTPKLHPISGSLLWTVSETGVATLNIAN